MQFNKDELIIYTVLIGSNNEGLNSQPHIKDSKYRHVCLTDNKSLISNDWEIINVEPIFPKDASRSQRYFKLKPHIIFPNYKYSLYFDNTIIFKVKIEEFLDEILTDKIINENQPFFLAPKHSYRKDLISEFKIALKYNRANHFKIYEQLNHYVNTNNKILKKRPYWAGIILRNHNNEKIIKHSEIWFSHLCRYTRRDQLSLLYAAQQAKITIYEFKIDNRKSEYHTWPIELKKRNKKCEDDLTDLLPTRIHEKTEKLISNLEFEKIENNTLLFKIKSYLKFIVRIFIRILIKIFIRFL